MPLYLLALILYRLFTENLILKENIFKTYKRSTNKKMEKINYTAKQITEKLSMADGVAMLEETEEAYVTTKDHKSESPNKIPVLVDKSIQIKYWEN